MVEMPAPVVAPRSPLHIESTSVPLKPRPPSELEKNFNPQPLKIDAMHPDTAKIDALPVAYQNNSNGVNGDGAMAGLYQLEVARVTKELSQIEQMQASLGASKDFIQPVKTERHWLPWLKKNEGDSKAVAEATVQLNETKSRLAQIRKEQDAYCNVTNGMGEKNIPDTQKDRFQKAAEVARKVHGTVTPEEQALLDSVKDIPQYQRFAAFENGGEAIVLNQKGKPEKRVIAQGEGRAGLQEKETQQTKTLTTAREKQQFARAGQKMYETELTPRQKELLEYQKQLDRISQFVQTEGQYIPTRDEVDAARAKAEAVLLNQEQVGKIDTDMADSFKEQYIDKGKMAQVKAKLKETIKGLTDTIDNLLNPTRRIAKCKDLARGVELAKLSDDELLALRRSQKGFTQQEQFQLAVVDILSGRQPRVDLTPYLRPETQAVAAGTAPPAEPGAPTRPSEAILVGENVPDEVLLERMRAFHDVRGQLSVDYLDRYNSEEALLADLASEGFQGRTGHNRWDPNNPDTKEFVHNAWLYNQEGKAQRQTEAAAPRAEANIPATVDTIIAGLGVDPATARAALDLGNAEDIALRLNISEAQVQELLAAHQGQPAEAAVAGVAGPPEGVTGSAAEAVAPAEYKGSPITAVEMNRVSQKILELIGNNPKILDNPDEAAAARRILMDEFGGDEARIQETLRLVVEKFKEAKPDKRQGLKQLLLGVGALGLMNVQPLLDEGETEKK